MPTSIELIINVVVPIGFSFLLTYILVRHYYNRPPSWIQDLFEPIDDKGTTKIDTWIARAVDSLFARFQYSLMGQKSGEVRLEKGLQSAMLDDMINASNPLIGMIMEQFPSVKSYLMKHPNALPQILSMIGPLLQQQTKTLKPSVRVNPFEER
jgi:hypothetical protein